MTPSAQRAKYHKDIFLCKESREKNNKREEPCGWTTTIQYRSTHQLKKEECLLTNPLGEWLRAHAEVMKIRWKTRVPHGHHRPPRGYFHFLSFHLDEKRRQKFYQSTTKQHQNPIFFTPSESIIDLERLAHGLGFLMSWYFLLAIGYFDRCGLTITHVISRVSHVTDLLCIFDYLADPSINETWVLLTNKTLIFTQKEEEDRQEEKEEVGCWASIGRHGDETWRWCQKMKKHKFLNRTQNERCTIFLIEWLQSTKRFDRVAESNWEHSTLEKKNKKTHTNTRNDSDWQHDDGNSTK